MFQTKMKNQVLLGIFIFAALLLAAWAILFLQPSYGDGQRVLRVRFPNIAKVSIGTRVTFAGRPVGEVAAISHIARSTSLENRSYGQVFPYELILEIDSSVKVYIHDEIALQTAGLLGEKVIAITPKAIASQEDLEEISESEVFYARSAGSMEDTVKQFMALALKTEETMGQISRLIETNNEEVFFTLRSLRHSVETLDKTIAYVQDIDLMGSLKQSSDTLQDLLSSMNRQVSGLESSKFFQHLALSMSHVKEMTEKFNTESFNDMQLSFVQMKDLLAQANSSMPQVLKSLNAFEKTILSFETMGKQGAVASEKVNLILDGVLAGEGDLGQLLKKHDLYFDAKAVMGKINTVLNDVNHYGLLFHLDKGWQRLRTKRFNLLNNLQTVRQFESFFSTELDQIGTSLTRMTLLLKDLDAYKPTEKQKDVFQKGFLQLIEDVNSFKQNLEFYQERKFEKNIK